jgi:hypothetical protein
VPTRAVARSLHAPATASGRVVTEELSRRLLFSDAKLRFKKMLRAAAETCRFPGR